jgi:PAS domain S-box-containing protein
MPGVDRARIRSSGMGSMVWFIGLVVFLFLQVAPVKAAAAPKRILALYWYNKDFPSNSAFDRSFQAALKSAPAGSIEYYTEYLESDRFPGEKQSETLRDYLRQKYASRSIDVVVAVSDVPLDFLLKYRDTLFTQTPIVFVAIKRPAANKPSGPGLTGIVMGSGYKKTLELALKLHPGTKQVFIISGTLNHDKEYETLCREELQGFDSGVSINYFTDLSVYDLIFRTKRLPERSLVLYIWQQLQNKEGQLLESADVLNAIAPSTTAPIYGVANWQVGRGVIGGYLRTFEANGTRAGEIALRIANGARAQDIPIEPAKTVPIFDWGELHRWGLKESALPPGSIVLNRQPTLWNSYKWYIVGGLCLFVAQTSLMVGLLWQRANRRKAEAELALTYDRLRLAVDAGNAVGWDLDVKTGHNRWFGDLRTMFGIPSDTFSGRAEDFYRRVHQEDQEFVRNAVTAARNSHGPYTAEFRVVRDDQALRWITARGKFYYRNNGEAERMVGMALDITDRKLAEEVRFRHAAIVESSPDAIISKNPDGVILSWNAGAQRLFGYSKAEVIGQPIRILIPADREDEENYILSRLRSGECIEQYETTRITKARTTIEVSLTISPIRDGIGKTIGYATIARDITERRRAEAAVRESEERFRLVANTAPVMIWTTGTDKLCNYVNKPWLDFTGRTLEQELGSGWAEGIHSEDVVNCLRTYTEAFDKREQFEMQYRVRRLDGEYRWVFDIGVPRFNHDGSFAGYIGSCLDVTERKRAEEALSTIGRRLIEAHEEERTWIGRELHDDINQRLALLAVELDQWKKGNSGTNFSEHLSHAKTRIMEISKDLQSLSHRLHSSKLDYLGLTTAARSFCKELAEKAKVEVQFNHSAVPSTMPKEVSLCLFRVLQEALQNAVKYSGARTFQVDLRGTSGGIELVVSDDGKGFDEQEALSHHGLGLISMRERMQMVHGMLKVKTGAGVGTTILARVPLQVAELRAKAG